MEPVGVWDGQSYAIPNLVELPTFPLKAWTMISMFPPDKKPPTGGPLQSSWKSGTSSRVEFAGSSKTRGVPLREMMTR